MIVTESLSLIFSRVLSILASIKTFFLVDLADFGRHVFLAGDVSSSFFDNELSIVIIAFLAFVGYGLVKKLLIR